MYKLTIFGEKEFSLAVIDDVMQYLKGTFLKSQFSQ